MLRFASQVRRLALVVATLVLVALAPTTGPATAADSPQQVVETFHGALLDVWRNADSLSVEQRFAKLDDPVRRAFDLESMIRFATGSSWKSASEAERQRLLEAFTRYSVANWASRFDSFKDQRFETVGFRPGPGDRTIVETRIVPRNEAPVTLDYVVEDQTGSPQIVDVVAKGVSELARLRSDYRSTLRREGPSGLATRIDELADQLLAP